MVIEEKDFRLTPISDCSNFFDLELLYTIKPNGKEARQEFKTAAYGLPLDSAIKKIAQYRISINHEDEAITLKDYIKEFKEEIDSLKKLLD